MVGTSSNDKEADNPNVCMNDLCICGTKGVQETIPGTHGIKSSDNFQTRAHRFNSNCCEHVRICCNCGFNSKLTLCHVSLRRQECDVTPSYNELQVASRLAMSVPSALPTSAANGSNVEAVPKAGAGHPSFMDLFLRPLCHWPILPEHSLQKSAVPKCNHFGQTATPAPAPRFAKSTDRYEPIVTYAASDLSRIVGVKADVATGIFTSRSIEYTVALLAFGPHACNR